MRDPRSAWVTSPAASPSPMRCATSARRVVCSSTATTGRSSWRWPRASKRRRWRMRMIPKPLSSGAGGSVRPPSSLDSYGFTPDDLAVFVAAGRPVAVFDDTANRELPVDLVINGGAGARALPYRGGPRTRYLLGPSYLALRPEFAEAAPRTIHDDVRRALVTLGGADPGRLVAPLVRWAIAGLGAITLDVVAGPLVDDVASVRAAVGAVAGPVVLHESPKHLRDLMLAADLAVTGGGQTVYELAATGTPMVAIGVPVAANSYTVCPPPVTARSAASIRSRRCLGLSCSTTRPATAPTAARTEATSSTSGPATTSRVMAPSPAIAQRTRGATSRPGSAPPRVTRARRTSS